MSCESDMGHNYREAFREVPQDFRRMPVDWLYSATVALLETRGVLRRHADQIARVLMYSDLRGNDTHGVTTLLRRYLTAFEENVLEVRPNIVVERESDIVSVVHANRAPGAVAMTKAVDVAAEIAQHHGLGAVFVEDAGHAAALGFYALRAAKQNVFALVMAAGRGLMVPPRSQEPLLGTNPIAYAIRGLDMPPLIFDASTTAICGNRVRLAQLRGVQLRSEWMAVHDPNNRTDDYSSELLPLLTPVGCSEDLGSHKGFGLALLCEVLCNTLRPPLADRRKSSQIGHFVLALNHNNCTSVKMNTDTLLHSIVNLQPREADGEVLYPGLRSFREAQCRFKMGIPLHPSFCAWLETELGHHGLEFHGEGEKAALNIDEFV